MRPPRLASAARASLLSQAPARHGTRTRLGKRLLWWPAAAGAALGRSGRRNQTGGRGLVCAGEKHWHGATPTTAMTHIAVQEKLDGKPVEWMEKVNDEQYRK